MKKFRATHKNIKTGQNVHVKMDDRHHFHVHSMDGKKIESFHDQDLEGLLKKYKSNRPRLVMKQKKAL